MRTVASVIGNLALPPRKPGTYLDRDGLVVVIETQGADGKWFGSIPGRMTRTWWYGSGRHNTYPRHDLKTMVEMEEGR